MYTGEKTVSVKRKAALVACSNPLQPGRREIIDLLCRTLERERLSVEVSPYLFDPEGYKLEKEKADHWKEQSCFLWLQ